MEQIQRETKRPKSSSSSSLTPRVDLPDSLTELILERLPLLYYLRFAAVCRKWRSIQNAHRLRYSPSPPPMAASLPWLIVPDLLDDSAPIPSCYSPFDRTLRLLRLPSTLPPHYFVASSHGWLLLLHKKQPSEDLTGLPLSSIPSLGLTSSSLLFAPSSMYLPSTAPSPPPPTDPNCSILLSINDNFFLHRRREPDNNNNNNNKWVRLDFRRASSLGSIENKVFHCSGKFYIAYGSMELYVVGPFLPMPSVQFVEMDDTLRFYVSMGDFVFQESDGEIFAVGIVDTISSCSHFNGLYPFSGVPFFLMGCSFISKLIQH